MTNIFKDTTLPILRAHIDDDTGFSITIGDDDGSISITDDSLVTTSGGLTSTSGSNGISGSITGITGGGLWTIGSNGAAITGNYPSFTGASPTGNQTSTILSNTSLLAKTDVEYRIVRVDDSVLALNVKNPITPREMIGITKFLNVVQSANGISVDWTSLIAVLDIERHFDVVGNINTMSYDDMTLYFMLHDPV